MGKYPLIHGSKRIIPIGNVLIFGSIRIANFSNVVSDRNGLSSMRYLSMINPKSNLVP